VHEAHRLVFVLDHQSLDAVLQLSDCGHQIAALIRCDAGCNHRSAHSAGASEGRLAIDVDIGYVLVLSKQWQVEQNGERGGIGSENDEFSRSTVQSLSGFVGALFELSVVLQALVRPCDTDDKILHLQMLAAQCRESFATVLRRPQAMPRSGCRPCLFCDFATVC
jgi:hypothetical protein